MIALRYQRSIMTLGGVCTMRTWRPRGGANLLAPDSRAGGTFFAYGRRFHLVTRSLTADQPPGTTSALYDLTMNSLKAKLEAFQGSRAGLFIKKVLDDQTPNLGALLAWGTLSTLLPLLLGILSIAGLVLRDQQRLDQVYSAIGAALPSGAAGPVTEVLDGMRQGSAAPVGIVAIVLLLISGSSFFTNMASVFDHAYHVEGRNMVVERLVGLGMLIIVTALLVLSALAAGVTSIVSNVPAGSLPVGPIAGQVLGWSLAIVSVFVLFLLVYRILPNARTDMAKCDSRRPRVAGADHAHLPALPGVYETVSAQPRVFGLRRIPRADLLAVPGWYRHGARRRVERVPGAAGPFGSAGRGDGGGTTWQGELRPVNGSGQS